MFGGTVLTSANVVLCQRHHARIRTHVRQIRMPEMLSNQRSRIYLAIFQVLPDYLFKVVARIGR